MGVGVGHLPHKKSSAANGVPAHAADDSLINWVGAGGCGWGGWAWVWVICRTRIPLLPMGFQLMQQRTVLLTLLHGLEGGGCGL